MVAVAFPPPGALHLCLSCTTCPVHAQSYPSSLHLFQSPSGISPILLTSAPGPLTAFLTVPPLLADGLLSPFSCCIEQLMSFGPPFGPLPVHMWSCVSVSDP